MLQLIAVAGLTDAIDLTNDRTLMPCLAMPLRAISGVEMAPAFPQEPLGATRP